jgi:hypothetical protein
MFIKPVKDGGCPKGRDHYNRIYPAVYYTIQEKSSDGEKEMH